MHRNALFRAYGLVLLSAFAALTCTNPQKRPEAITFWALGSEGEQVRGLLTEFERRNPGIRVILQQIPWTAAHEKLLTAIAGQSTPDICQIGNTWISEFASLNVLERLGDRVRRSSAVDTSDIFAGVLDPNVIDSCVYAIPWYVDTRVLFYRSDLLRQAGFDRPPRTWDEWKSISKRMKQLARGEFTYPMFFPTNEWVPVIMLGVQRGATLLSDNNTRGNFRSPEFRSAFEYLMSYYRDRLSPVGMTIVPNRYQAFAEGFIAMYVTGPWNIGEFRRRMPAEVQNAWMTAPMPTPDSVYPGCSLALGTSLVLFANSPHKASAWRLLEFLSDVPQQLAFYQITGNLPVRKSAWRDSAFASNPYVQAFHRQLQRVMALPKIPEMERIAIRVQELTELAAGGSLSVDETLARMDHEVDHILEKRRWLVQRSLAR